MQYSPLLSALLASFVSACGASPPGRAAAVEPSELSSPEEREGPPADAQRASAPPAPGEHFVKLTESTAPSEEHEVSVPEPVQTRLEACHPRHDGGKLRFRIVRDQGQISFRPEPGSPLDPTERQCALQALKEMRQDDIASSLWSGATVPATGYTPLLTIEW
jgi:hypothetical protein